MEVEKVSDWTTAALQVASFFQPERAQRRLALQIATEGKWIWFYQVNMEDVSQEAKQRRDVGSCNKQ